MSETLLGVIIGGLIGSVGTLVTLTLDFKKWKKERKIQFLKEQRDRLSKSYKESYDKIAESMIDNIFPVAIATEIICLFPEKVCEAFNKMVNDKDDLLQNKRQHLFNFSLAMNNSLAEIDQQIKDTVG